MVETETKSRIVNEFHEHNLLASFIKYLFRWSTNIDKHICLVDRADTTFRILKIILRVLYAISLLYQRKVVVEKTNSSMLLIFSIKEKVSKENGKEFKMNLNGLTSGNSINN